MKIRSNCSVLALVACSCWTDATVESNKKNTETVTVTPKPNSSEPCKLYKTGQSDPKCCPTHLGFNTEIVAQQCGLGDYLGEALFGSCGFYFGKDVVFRIKVPLGETATAAATIHDRIVRTKMALPEFSATPVPGTPGAWWSSHGDLTWAFLPASTEFPQVRQLTWTNKACPRASMQLVIGGLVGTGQQ